jgi:4-hydroxybenzoate polyprenyltransferase
MKKSSKRSAGQIAIGFFLLTHPGPVAIHILGVAVFALLAAWSHLVWGVLLLVIIAHAAMQCSISMVNDYCDRRLDATSKPNKPIVRGYIHPQEALAAGIAMMLLMLVLLLFLPPLALLLSLIYLALGQAYNLGLKSTPWSGLVFALAIPLIPLYALAGVGRLPLAALWMIPVGFLLGAALNLANSLPDIESDLAGNATTLAVKLGVKWSFLACPLLIALSVALMGALIIVRAVPTPSVTIVVLLIAALLVAGALLFFFGPTKPLPTRKWYFYMTALTCLILGAAWFTLIAL